MAADETRPQPGVVPTVCEGGHRAWPVTPVVYVRVRGRSEFSLDRPMRCGDCAECGKPRWILPGVYRDGPDGLVTADADA